MITKQNILTVLASFFTIYTLNFALVFGRPETMSTETESSVDLEEATSGDFEDLRRQFAIMQYDKEDLERTLTELNEHQKMVQDKKDAAAIGDLIKDIKDGIKKYEIAKKLFDQLNPLQKKFTDKTAELKKIEEDVNTLTTEAIAKAEQVMKLSPQIENEPKKETALSAPESKSSVDSKKEDNPLIRILQNLEDITKKISELDGYQKTAQDPKAVAEIQNVKKEIETKKRTIEQNQKTAQNIFNELRNYETSIQAKKSEFEKIKIEINNMGIIAMIDNANQLMNPSEKAEDTPQESTELKQLDKVITVSITDKQKREVRESLNCLAWNMFSKSGNTPICPYSAAIVLNMLREGADGATAAEMEKFLGTKLQGNPYFVGMKALEDSNFSSLKIYSMVVFALNEKPVPQYTEFINQSKGFINDDVVIANADFASRPLDEMDKMNNWFSDVTKGEIQKVFTKISPQTQAVLANVTTLDAKWMNPFKKGKEGDFFLKDGKTKKMPMMSVAANVKHEKFTDYEVLILPYRNNMGMVIILPKDFKTLQQIQTKNKVDWFKDSVKKTSWKDGKVTMPPFKVEGNTNLIPLFCQLGLKNTFSSQADFSKIFGKNSIIVDQFLQKVVVDVNEVGTKATAATVATLALRGGVRKPEFQIEINRPFIYAIIDSLDAIDNSTILFIGVMDGSGAEVKHE